MRLTTIEALSAVTAVARVTSVRPIKLGGFLVLGALALTLGGCRSDGGVGRRDSQRSLAFTYDAIERQYEKDVKATDDNMSGISNWWTNETTDPWDGIDRTVNLYLEGDTRR